MANGTTSRGFSNLLLSELSHAGFLFFPPAEPTEVLRVRFAPLPYSPQSSLHVREPIFLSFSLESLPVPASLKVRGFLIGSARAFF